MRSFCLCLVAGSAALLLAGCPDSETTPPPDAGGVDLPTVPDTGADPGLVVPDVPPTDVPPTDVFVDTPVPDVPPDVPAPDAGPLDVPTDGGSPDVPVPDVPPDVPAPDVPPDVPAVDVPPDIPIVDVPPDVPSVDVPPDVPPVDVPPDIPPDIPPCGDGTCDDASEDCSSCPADCGACPTFCGDGNCDDTETEDCATCPSDCGACPGPCGDGECDLSQGETCETCSDDCGDCAVCGDTSCDVDADESCSTCPDDCGACAVCTDNVCDPSESCETCPFDCGFCPSECGDGWCEYGVEECDVCFADCGPCTPACGDSVCSWPESCESCPVDCDLYCSQPCGDGVCDPADSETCTSCAEDCGVCSDSCGSDGCEADETCDTCPADCGDCPPTVTLTRYWRTELTGPVVADRDVRLVYDPYRSGCKQWEQSTPIWTTFLYHAFDLADPQAGLPAVRHQGTADGLQSLALYNTVSVPVASTDLWLWAHTLGFRECSMWDSKGGANHWVPVFQAAEVQQDVGTVDNLKFMTQTLSGLTDDGDLDPAYYFASMASEGTVTWIQFDVFVPGITDRPYAESAMAAQVARVALRAEVVTDAYGQGPPGQAMQAAPVEFIGVDAGGTKFVYRWFPGALTWGGTPVQDGAYAYRFEVRTVEGTNTTTLGLAGGGDRTVVLSQNPDCGLFPANPPATYCP